MSYDRHYTGPPWSLHCPYCAWSVLVHNRGARGNDPGAGVEAAMMRERHVAERHPEMVATGPDAREGVEEPQR